MFDVTFCDKIQKVKVKMKTMMNPLKTCPLIWGFSNKNWEELVLVAVSWGASHFVVNEYDPARWKKKNTKWTLRNRKHRKGISVNSSWQLIVRCSAMILKLLEMKFKAFVLMTISFACLMVLINLKVNFLTFLWINSIWCHLGSQ